MEHSEIGLDDVRQLGDVELIAGLHRLVRADQALTARLLVHLGEMDARGLYREHAFQSMFAYAVEELHMSEAQAYLRIQAARLAREFPLVLRMLAKGELHLTAIKLLAPHLTLTNHAGVLERARFKGKREVELLVAELAPKPDVPSGMRKLREPAPVRATSLPLAQMPVATATDERNRVPFAQPHVAAATDRNPGDSDREPLQQPPFAPADEGTRVPLSQPSVAATMGDTNTHSDDADREAFQLKAPPARVSSTTPLRPGRYEVKFTAGQAMQSKLERLQDLLRHQVPDRDLGIILERAADLLLEKTMKERFAQKTRKTKIADSSSRARASERPTPSPSCATVDEPREITSSARPSQAHSRYVPRAVVREVYARDGEQCTFVSPDGRRCAARAFLELHHHDTPYARGGAATAANLRTVCRAHNALLAERDFGRAFMQSKLARARLRKRTFHNEQVPEREQE